MVSPPAPATPNPRLGQLSGGGAGITSFRAGCVDPPSLARGEHDENVHRKHLLLTELVAICELAEAEERDPAQAGDRVAKVPGIGARLPDKATKVVEVADRDPPATATCPGGPGADRQGPHEGRGRPR
jgi:hypothetical protein